MEATLHAVIGVSLADFVGAQSVSLTRFAYVLCGDRGLAEDLVQDAFVALYRRFGERLPIAAPVAYARRTIVNANISHARKRESSSTVLGEVPEGTVEDPGPADQDAMWHASRPCRIASAPCW